MGPEERFDSFYRSTRNALVLQVFALTGDLPAAHRAVRDAYVATWHHWRRVAAYDDPQDWVRPRAWRHAQRRHAARIWHRGRGLSAHDRAVLAALAKLPLGQRKVLVLTQLAGVPLARAAGELEITEEVAERHLQAATASFATHLDVDSARCRPHLLALAGAVQEGLLPRGSIIRRAGRRRRRAQLSLAAAGAAAVAAVAVVVAVVVAHPDPVPAGKAQRDPPVVAQPAALPSTPRMPGPAQLLDSDQISRLGSGQPWHVVTTSHNVTGTGIHSICQQTRFADPDGLSALVRTFEASGRQHRSAVQTVETSRTPAQARRAFQTTLGWYAGCRLGRLQLLDAYRVDGVGDEARMLRLRLSQHPVRTYSVAVARTGRLTTTTVAETNGGPPAPLSQVSQSLADSVAMLCGTSRSAGCAKQPSYAAVPPPPAGEPRGLLAVVDLPPVGTVDRPWVGTRPGVARPAPPGITCDAAELNRGGAAGTRTRAFLIPQAALPDRFGLSETTGRFDSPRAAARFLDTARSRVARCEDRDLAVKVTSSWTDRSLGPRADVSAWDLQVAVSAQESVRFRLGLVRVGDRVAALSFSPAPEADISAAGFRALLARAGDRLRELPSDSG